MAYCGYYQFLSRLIAIIGTFNQRFGSIINSKKKKALTCTNLFCFDFTETDILSKVLVSMSANAEKNFFFQFLTWRGLYYKPQLNRLFCGPIFIIKIHL